MISTEFYDGQGLGNQLWAYVVTRLIAEHKKCGFSIIHPERFKGRGFMTLDFGEKNPVIEHSYKEVENVVNGHSMWPYDPELFNVPLNTKIDGNFQSYGYIRGKEDLIRSWIKLEIKAGVDGNVCIVHFRAGDYLGIKDVFLPKKYYLAAMEEVKKLNPSVRFYCVSDQPNLAEEFLGVQSIGGVGEDRHKASHHYGGDVGVDFSYLVQAEYLVIPNSSFSWWAAFLNTNKKIVVAPEFWAGWKRGVWQTSDIKSDGFTYVQHS